MQCAGAGVDCDGRVVGFGHLDVHANVFDGLEGLEGEADVEFLELGAGDGLEEVVFTFEGFDLELGGHLGREGTLGFFDFALELAHGVELLGGIDAGLLLVLRGDPFDDSVVKVLSTEMGVARPPKTCDKKDKRPTTE